MAKKFRIKVEYTFKGVIDIKCDSKEEALIIAKRDFGATQPHYNSSNEQIVNWEFGVHPYDSKAK